MFKESIDIWRKMRWLKIINKECDKYKKLKSKLSKQQFIVNALIEAYSSVYGENLRKPKEMVGEDRKEDEGK